MNNIRENQEFFEVLGHKLKLKKDDSLKNIEPVDIVAFVQTEASKIINQSPALSQSQVATLLALKFAGEKLSLEKEYCENVKLFQKEAREALQIVEEFSLESLHK